MQNAQLSILNIVFRKKDAILMKNLLVNDKSMWVLFFLRFRVTLRFWNFSALLKETFLQANAKKYRISNEKIKYINSAQTIYNYFDFLVLCNKVNKLDAIIKFNYANFK